MRPQFISKKVGSIQFRVLSPKMIKAMAAAKIVTPELYDREGYPVDGGLMDTRLGVIDPGLVCRTDGLRLKDTLGHFGYIELARPTVHIKFVRQVYDFLKCTCNSCGRVLIPQKDIKRYSDTLQEIGEDQSVQAQRRQVREIVTKYKGKGKCPHCASKQGKIKLEKPYTFHEEDRKLSPIELRAWLERIPDEDLELFGMNAVAIRPEWMILTVLQIPPVTMRPSITLESGERSEDDLTHKLGDVVRINQRLFENINAGAPEIIIEDLWDLLQYHVTTYFDNTVAQLPPARHRGGQVLKTLTKRIKSKEGRIRHNLAGKRTDFSARTVISPDPLISLNEVGVPKKMAMHLTIPERITEWNKAYLLEFVNRGPKVYPGANYIIRPDGKRKAIADFTMDEITEELTEGYIVERHLLDGDIALFNRQPSLHRMSMMAHKVRVLPGKTFRLNPSVCHPYNADFDGDEMNLHVPQTEEARSEAEVLMLVQTQLISPRDGLSVVGSIHDAITGNYLLTKELILSYPESVDLLYSCGVSDLSNLAKKEKLDGKEVFSALLPTDFTFFGKDKSGNEVKIINGKLKSGLMDKANLGEESGLLLRNLYSQYGAAFTADLLGKISKLGIAVLLRRGFSIGIGDLDLMPKTAELVKQSINDSEQKAFDIIEKYEAGKLPALAGRTVQETLELRLLEVLNKARNKSGEVAMKQIKENAALVMARSGARGNILNIAQMSAITGQQALRGRRIDKGFTDRTLSYFKKHDISPAARGFIKNSFKSGLDPAEFFFGAMTGRDALMDTALRTPKSGYLYRRLSNAMQDLKVEYDHTVRDASGRIVQFKYGEDGFDVSKTKAGSMDVKESVQAVIGEKQ